MKMVLDDERSWEWAVKAIEKKLNGRSQITKGFHIALFTSLTEQSEAKGKKKASAGSKVRCEIQCVRVP
jgi:acid phosphatase class B